VVDASTSGARKVSIQLGLTIVPENISKGELMAQKENRRKVRAILAGGLVLGIGAAVTLASWSDSEFAKGTFGAGHFNMQGSLNGTAFSDHPVGTPAQLAFPLDKLSPGDVVAAPFALRLDAGTTNRAKVSVKSTTDVGTAVDQLTYSIEQVASFDACSPESTGTAIVVPEAALGTDSGPTTLELPMSAVANEPGAIVNLCVQVRAGTDLKQGTGAVATWEFIGESVS
jgi:predicted ribosomally synthesized peptide with SipW-like signal peptide